ncbi:hypothetical protein BT96DRAFT_923641 [Gymnopus androsaceus JB14]|uniref:Uncharacterized protein n=1 Tax=Gymnopus androsaceus JB14 TaxID=1447944 RepID=A0A6A4H9A3_9AGAR|nr:hypothetical protein BT96DRAFT_923641 [Gymnopus androsaceus JB14]
MPVLMEMLISTYVAALHIYVHQSPQAHFACLYITSFPFIHGPTLAYSIIVYIIKKMIPKQ